MAVIGNVFQNTAPADFEKEYGRSKPQHSTEMIFSCGAGLRAAKAADEVSKLGYNK